MLVRAHLRALFFGFCLISMHAQLLAQSSGPAWSRKHDEYFLRFGVTWLTASQEYGLDGHRHTLFEDSLGFRNAKYGQTDVAFLGEYGITSWLTAVAQTQLRTVVREAFSEASGRDTTISASGLADLWIGARIRLLPASSKYLATATLAWKAPMGSPTQEIPLGTGVPDYALGLAGAIPYEIGSVNGHFQAAGDFRLRNRANNEVAYLAQLDVQLGRGLIMQGSFDGIGSLADFDAGASNLTAVNRSVVGDRSFGRWSVGLLLEADTGLDLGASFSDHVMGRNAVATSAFALSATWRGPIEKEDAD